MTATKRRRYVFPTRQDAEDAYNRRGQENGELCAALNAIVNGKVTWLAEQFGEPTRYYRFGYYHRRFASFAFVTFHCEGQTPHTAVYEESRVSDEYRTACRFTPSDDEARAHRDGLRAVLTAIQDTRPND